MSVRNRVEVMHGVNLDQLGRRPAADYGELTYDRLQQQVEGYARELGLAGALLPDQRRERVRRAPAPPRRPVGRASS